MTKPPVVGPIGECGVGKRSTNASRSVSLHFQRFAYEKMIHDATE